MNETARRSQASLVRVALRGARWLLGESPTSTTQATSEASAHLPRGFSMSVNTVMLMASAIVSAVLGYPFWLLTARLFDPADVGLGSGAISAIRLCSQIGLLGIGSAVTLLLPRQRRHPSDLLNVAITVGTIGGAVFAGGFLLLSLAFFGQFRFLAASPVYAVAFLVLNITSALAMLFDTIFIALRRSDKVATRSVWQALAALAAVGFAGLALHMNGVLAIMLAWIGAFVASIVLGVRYLHADVSGYRIRPRITRSIMGSLLHIGVPQSVLALAISAPGYILPILVTEVLSPTANAYWYIVWMFGGLVFAVPTAASGALFAESSSSPELANQHARQSIRLCLLLGIPMAVGMAVFASWGLSLMGADYARGGATALRILVIAVIPRTVISAYVSRERAANRVTEPTVISIVGGVLSVVGPAIGGVLAGLPGVAAAWVLAQFATALWAVWRLRDAYSSGSDLSRTGLRQRDAGGAGVLD